MSDKRCAGLLMYRFNKSRLELLLAHPGGPLFEGRNDGCWSIPKGEVEPGETVLAAAIREFNEETGFSIPRSYLLPLGTVSEPSGRLIHAWAFPGDCDTTKPVASNLFSLEWPQGSGNISYYPEIDNLEFCSILDSKRLLENPQFIFIERLAFILAFGLKSA